MSSSSHAFGITSTTLAALIALPAAAGFETLWLTPRSGDFADPARWSSGVPTARMLGTFGDESSSEPFIVSFATDTSVGFLGVVTQSPLFALNGTALTCIGVTVAGETAPSATFANGTLTSSFLHVGLSGNPGNAVLDHVSGDIEEIEIGSGPAATLTVIGPGTVTAQDVAIDDDSSLLVRDGAHLATSHLTLPGSFSASLVSIGPGTLILAGSSGLAPEGETKRFRVEDGGTIGLQTGLYEFNGDDELHYVIGPNGSGSINCYGGILLGGTLKIEIAPGFAPIPGSVYPLFWANSQLESMFDTLDVPTFGGVPMSIIKSGLNVIAIVPSVSSTLSISPSPIPALVGFPTHVDATLTYEGSLELPLQSGVTWSIDDASIATVSPSGVVIGQAPGRSIVRAAYGSLVAEAPVIVTKLPGDASIIRASQSTAGVGGNDESASVDNSWPAISGDGRLVVFESRASNLIDGRGDTNGLADIFVHHRLTHETRLVSVAPDGTQANQECILPSISDDGRFVSFSSAANNLDPGDSDNSSNVFVYDLEMSTIERLGSPSPGPELKGTTQSELSADGRYVAVKSNSFGYHVYRFDRLTKSTAVVSADQQGDVVSVPATSMIDISGDGSSVAFITTAKLVREQPGNDVQQVWLRDFSSGDLICASRSSDGTFGDGACLNPCVSGDARLVAFISYAKNLVDGPTDQFRDAFVFDRATGVIEQVNVNDKGVPANETIGSLSISSDGRFVSYRSAATNLVNSPVSDNQMYRYDRLTHTVELVSVGPAGPANSSCAHGSATSADGAFVAFGTAADNLVAFDSNGFLDTFVRSMDGSVVGDLDGDQVVGSADLAILLGAWGTNDYFADLDHDGSVGSTDLGLLLGAWSTP